MRKAILTALVLVIMAARGNSTLPVIDYTSIAHQIASYITQLQQYVKDVQQTVDQDTLVLRQLQQLENQILELERMGDPKAYGFGLPGVSNIATLFAIYQQATKDVSDWAAYVNPKSWQITLQQIENIYGISQFNGFTSANGLHIGQAQSLINFYTSNYNVAGGAQQSLATLNAKKQTLTQQRDAAIAQLQSASDQSAVQKQSAIIVALNGAIADVNASIAQAVHNANLQIAQNNQAQAISQNVALQQQAAAAYQGIDQDLSNLPVQGFRSNVLWGNP
jgi:hypothetical protein